ncbi:MAG: NAD(P)H-hydrate dehydratase [Clostridia bacterium]|nr:NAD(P)H-hydrate dehydratase [Clostridia bacterium]MDD4048110.1 NAD(P)H-hydrate dehydratase [Clostridia bacterium]
MRIISGTDMKMLDAWAEGKRGISPFILMENAGQSVATIAQELCREKGEGNYIILVGKGNNGGDALVVARHLYQQGKEVKLFLLFKPDNFKGTVKENWRYIKQFGIKWHYLLDENSFYLLKLCLNNCNMVIDGIFGTGFREGQPQDNILRAIKLINDSRCPVLAIDVPTGVDADNGQVRDVCIKAQSTVTFAWAKRGLILYPARKYVGQLIVADISLPKEGLALLDREEYYVDKEFVLNLLPERDVEGYKNTFGHALVIAGSKGMMGAAFLTSKGVLRSGAGMVTACLPESLADLFDLALPEALTKGVTETDEKGISSLAWQQIKQYIKGKKAIVFGPGVGTSKDIFELLKQLLTVKIPIVLDADGLNALSKDMEILENDHGPIILTPHPGEMARLLGTTVANIQENRVEVAIQVATTFKVIVVLKGAGTIIASPEGQLYINSTGCSALATAGSGDVLAGTIGGLLAQGLNPVEAAVLGVYLHGLTGELVAEEKGLRGVMAGDIVEALPLSIKRLERSCIKP